MAAGNSATIKEVLEFSEIDKATELYVLGLLDGIEIANLVEKEKEYGPYCKPTDFRITVDQIRRITRDWVALDKRREEANPALAMYFSLLKTCPCK